MVLGRALSRRMALIAAAGLALPAHGRDFLKPEDFGARGDDRHDDARALNETFAAALKTGRPVMALGTYYATETIAPGGAFVLLCGPQFHLRFDPKGQYRAVPRREGADIGPSGVGVAFDLASCRGSTVTGPFTISAANPSNMTMSERERIPNTLCALGTSSFEPAGETVWDRLTIQGFGYGFYQGDMRGRGRKTLPFTRIAVRHLQTFFTLHPFRTGAWGNGLDDAWIDVLRISRCGDSLIQATELNVGSAFNLGFRREDAEGEWNFRPGDLTPPPGARSGLAVAALGALRGDRPSQTALVCEVVAGRLATPPEVAGQGLYFIDPPSLRLRNATLNATHYFAEQIFDRPVDVGRNASLRAVNFKISAGLLAARDRRAIHLTHASARAEIGRSHRNTASDLIKSF